MTSEPDDTVSAPLYALTDTDHSAIVILITVVSSLVMLTTLAIKLSLTRKHFRRYPFDTVLFLAALVSVVQTATTLYAGYLGLGKHENSLNNDVVEEIRQVLSLPCPHALSSCLVFRFMSSHMPSV